MSEENNAEVSVETTETVDWESRAKKAEAKIVEMKKSTTQTEEAEVKTEVPSKGFDENVFEAKYAEKKFFENNPEMSEYKEQLSEYVSKGIEWEKAKKLVELDDPSIANRKIAHKTNFTSGDVPSSSTYTQEEIAKMPLEKRAKIYDDFKKGKVTITP